MTEEHATGPAATIPVRPILRRSDLAYRQFIVAGLLLAVLVGFVLAIHVPLGRLLDTGRPERTADLIQAHGQVQLLGFAGLYIMGMSLRLLPRFTGARLQLEALVRLVLWTMVASLFVRAILLPWFYGDAHDALLIASSFGVLLASGAYALVVSATLSVESRQLDASSFAFQLGAFMLFAASAVGTFAAIDAVDMGARSVSYLTNVTITQLQLMGFLIVSIVGVAVRALPTLVGRERPQRGAALLPVAVVACVTVHAGSLLYLEYGSYSQGVAIIAGIALSLLGLCLLLFDWQAGILRPWANRARPASQPHLWLVRGAFFWLTVAAGLMLYFGLSSAAAGELLTQSEFDGMRHALGLGLVTNLILGMSLLILPEFAVERQRENQQRRLAILLAILINTSVVLRIAPSIAGEAWTFDQRNLSIAVAGSLAELAMLVFAFYLLRLIWQTRSAFQR